MSLKDVNDRAPILTGILIIASLAGPLGCRSTGSKQPAADRLVIVVPGAGGAAGLGGLVRGLRDADPHARYETFAWGAPPPLFMLNLQNQAIHDDAERKLARLIADRAAATTTAMRNRVQLVAHSAGCGVALGALRRLDRQASPVVSLVVLIAPSVSPAYDLSACAQSVGGPIHVFYSDRDNLWLSWRTGTFGTYDNVKTRAAGNAGFAEPTPANVVQHPYDETWKSLGNRGGHFDALSRQFAHQIIAPLLLLPPHQGINDHGGKAPDDDSADSG